MEIKITSDIKSMRFSTQVDEKLTRLSLKLGRTKKQLFSQMVDYFYRTKKDPTDLNDEMLKKEITAGISKIVSFYKQQENDLLIPQFETVNNMEISIHNFLDNSEHTSEKLNQLAFEQQAVIRSLSQLQSNILDKKDLKFQFSLWFIV